MKDKSEESEAFKDDFIRDIVKQAARSMPNDNFENQMMLKIQAESAYKKEVSAQLRTSLKFFIGALLAGIGLTLAVLFGSIFDQFEFKTISIVALFIICLVGVLNIDNYMRLIKKYS